MTSLASLDLTNNSLTEIPWTLKDLSHLGDLNLSSSWSYIKCDILEILYLRNNKLTSIPALTNCINLKELHLGSNRIQGERNLN